MMVVLIVERAPPRLRGRLRLWMMEVSACVYVIDCNFKMRDWIWETVVDNIGRGSSIQVWSTSRTAFGYDMRSVGDTNRIIHEVDGITFMAEK